MALLKGAKERGESYSEFFLFHHTPTHSILSTSLPFYLSFFPPCSIQSHLSSTIPSLPFIFFPFLHASPISLNAIPFPHPISSSPITSHPLSFLLSLPSLPPPQITLSYSPCLSYPFPLIPSHPRSCGTCFNPDFEWRLSSDEDMVPPSNRVGYWE